MDDRTDFAYYAIERKYGPLPEENTHWEGIIETHYDECPMAIAAHKKIKSTLCVCKELGIAEMDARIEKEDREIEKGA